MVPHALPASMIALVYRRARRFGRDRSGATAIEYALLAGLTTVIALSAMLAFGGTMDEMYTEVVTAINDALTG